MDSNTRKKDVLKVLIETFVHTNQPVGSMQIAEQLPYEVSSATVRNDVAEMTALGLLAQPHTSAGRVPTDTGYRHYVKMLTQQRRELNRRQREALLRHFQNLNNLQEKYQAAAKLLAELSGNIGFLMDDAKNIYLSGFSNVAKLPEFADESFRVRLMKALEQPEEFVEELSGPINPENPEDTNVFIGDTPRVRKTTIVISNFGPQRRRIVSIIGPTRMEYKKALPLVRYMKELLDEIQ